MEVWEWNGFVFVNMESIGMLMEIVEIYNWKVREKEMYVDFVVYYIWKVLVKVIKNFDFYDLRVFLVVEDLYMIMYMYVILK